MGPGTAVAKDAAGTMHRRNIPTRWPTIWGSPALLQHKPRGAGPRPCGSLSGASRAARLPGCQAGGQVGKVGITAGSGSARVCINGAQGPSCMRHAPHHTLQVAAGCWPYFRSGMSLLRCAACPPTARSLVRPSRESSSGTILLSGPAVGIGIRQ